jgi:AsmA protein
LIFPDPESLLRRSPASAPLLDAVKDRKTRDAVRSVLERFTGGGAKPAVPDAAAAPASVPAAAAAAPTSAPAAAEVAKPN